MTEKRSWLTEEYVGPGTPRKAFYTLVGMLVLLLAVNFAVVGLRRTHPANRAYWLVREKWLMLERLDHDLDFLVLGDSSGNQGVRPDLLGEAIGGRARGMNLCTVADMLVVNDAWMLQRYLGRHAPPKRVVMIHSYDAWSRREAALDRWLIWDVPLSFGFWGDLEPQVNITRSVEVSFFAWRYLPLYSDHTTVATWITTPDKFGNPYHADADGFMGFDVPSAKGVDETVRSHLATIKRGDAPPITAINLRALAVIQRLADRHGFDVYLASSPLYEGAWSDGVLHARFDAVQAGLKMAVKGSARMHVLFDEPPLFSKTEMENVNHVVGPAAAEYTRRVAAAMAVER